MTAPRAAVVYRSRSGQTRRYGEEIAAYLGVFGVLVTSESIADRDPAALAGIDIAFLGCWTNGWFVIRQHPDGPWVSWCRDLPPLPATKVVLFTTYRLATGSMFRRMREELARTGADVRLELASRNGRLSEQDRLAIAEVVRGR